MRREPKRLAYSSCKLRRLAFSSVLQRGLGDARFGCLLCVAGRARADPPSLDAGPPNPGDAGALAADGGSLETEDASDADASSSRSLPLDGATATDDAPLSDVALDRGLQRVIQSEVGVSVTLPASFSVETKVFAHFYDHMLSLEALEQEASNCEHADDGTSTCTANPEAFGRMSAFSYGLELLLRRAFTEEFSGWLAYTLSQADGRTDSGINLRPNFDVRHVANLIFLWRINANWRVSLRGYVQSGRFPLGATTEENPRARHRLPPFWRGDLQVARVWHKRWGQLQLSFDWLNFTFRKEPISWSNCPEPDRMGSCKVEYLDVPITVPMLGLRGSF